MYPYNNFPQGYPQTFPQTYPYQGNVQSAPMQPAPQPQNVQQPTIQNGGFVSIPSIEDAQKYPVAPGNAVTFKIEGQPIVCEKSQGFSQFEAPRFDVFDLVRRDAPAPVQNADTGAEKQPTVDLSGYVKMSDFEAFAAKYSDISTIVENLSREVEKIHFDVDAMTDKKSTKKMVQNARKDAEEE